MLLIATYRIAVEIIFKKYEQSAKIDAAVEMQTNGEPDDAGTSISSLIIRQQWE